MEIPRLLLRNVRSVLRRLKPDRAARLGPQWIVLRSGPQGLVVQAQDAEVALSARLEGSRPPEVLALLTTSLAELEGRTGDVILDAAGTEKVQARWTDGAVPRVVEFDTTDLAKLPKFPEVPGSLVSNPPGFLNALDQAMRTTANDNHRYALAKVQVRGSAGQLVASDGRQALIQGGFRFGFAQDVLIPHVTVFGCRELPQDVPVQVGKNDKWLAVQVGAWTFFLATDTQSRYPRVEEVLPKARPTTVWRLDRSEAEFLRQALPKLPGERDENSPVTVDLNGHAVIRAKGDGQNRTVELPLDKSTAEGKAVRFCTNRHLLARVLQIGLSEVHIVDADTPLVAKDGSRQYLWMPLPKSAALQPSTNAQRIAISKQPEVRATPTMKRRIPMARPRSNGHAPPPVNCQPAANSSSIASLIDEAREVKSAMRALYGRSNQLLTSLQQHRRRAKIVDSTLASLKKLQARSD